MYKLAEQVKEAEVRGCMAAFVDAGMVKVAGQAAFDELCSVVADNVGDNYDLAKVAAVTEAVLNGAPARMTKVAAETARNAALGELLMMKVAGEIDDRTFVKTAQELAKMAYFGLGGDGVDLEYKEPTYTKKQLKELKAQGIDPTVARGPLANVNPLELSARERGYSGNISPEEAAKFDKKVNYNRNFDNEWAMKESLKKQRHNEEKAALADAIAAQEAKAAKRAKIQRYGRNTLYGLGGAAALAGSSYLAKQLYDKYAA